MKSNLAVLVALLLLTPSCKKSEESQPAAKEPTPAVDKPSQPEDMPTEAAPEKPPAAQATKIDIPNAVVYQNNLMGGQPSAEQYGEIAKAGYGTVIDLRSKGESDAEGNRATVEGLGMKYVGIPVASAEDLTRENAEKLAEALKDGHAVVHCASGNRVGALMALKERWIDGVSADEALEHGKTIGLSSLEDAVKEVLAQTP